MFELNHRYTYNAPAGTISQTGIDMILTLVRVQTSELAAWNAANPGRNLVYVPGLPEAWDWVWLIQHGAKYRGTFPKRVSAYYHEVHKLKCPPTFLSAIGNIARAHSLDAVAYEFEFVDKFDWSPGDFADSGSCYWWKGGAALKMLSDHGALAIRFFDAEGDGIARAWLYKVEDEDQVWVLWNGYGFPNPTLTIAQIVAGFLNLPYRKVEMTNNDVMGGTLYINSAGYLIGHTTIAHWDFMWEDPYAELCESCGRMIHESEVFYGTDNMPYCESCYYEYFDSCSWCGETHDRENLTYTVDGDVCEYCLSRHYAYCEECEEYRRAGEVVCDDGRCLCDNCRPDEPDEPDEADSE